MLVVRFVDSAQASRLTVKAWTLADRRVILPKARTVIRIGEWHGRRKPAVNSSLNDYTYRFQRPCRVPLEHGKNSFKAWI